MFIKCIKFYKVKVAFIAINLLLFHAIAPWIQLHKIIARVWNCPDIPILNSILSFFFFSFCLFVFCHRGLSMPGQLGVNLCQSRTRKHCLFMRVSNLCNFANVKLHSLQMDFFCFMWLAPSIHYRKGVIFCPPGARWHRLFMCLLMMFYLTNLKLHSLH